MAGASALTSSLVRPDRTLCGCSSASQPARACSSRLWISSHCSPSSSSNAVRGVDPGRRDVRTIVNRPRSFSPARPELELAVPDRGRRIGRLGLRFPGAPVPHDHVAGAVLAGRDHPLEVEVLERMVLDVDGHPARGRVQRRALRHGPRHQHAVDLEPEVIVEAGCAMPLDDEPPAAGRRRRARGPSRRIPLRHARCRLRCLREVALAAVLLERHDRSMQGRAELLALRRSCGASRVVRRPPPRRLRRPRRPPRPLPPSPNGPRVPVSPRSPRRARASPSSSGRWRP